MALHLAWAQGPYKKHWRLMGEGIGGGAGVGGAGDGLLNKVRTHLYNYTIKNNLKQNKKSRARTIARPPPSHPPTRTYRRIFLLDRDYYLLLLSLVIVVI